MVAEVKGVDWTAASLAAKVPARKYARTATLIFKRRKRREKAENVRRRKLKKAKHGEIMKREEEKRFIAVEQVGRLFFNGLEEWRKED